MVRWTANVQLQGQRVNLVTTKEVSGQLTVPGGFTKEESLPISIGLRGPHSPAGHFGRRDESRLCRESKHDPSMLQTADSSLSLLFQIRSLSWNMFSFSKGRGFRMLKFRIKKQQVVTCFCIYRAHSKSSLECEDYMSILSSGVLEKKCELHAIV